MGKATGTGQRLTSKARFAATSSVASEVRNLAQRSAAAVKGIKALISASVNAVGRVRN
jgi:hypothetical protein